MSDLETFRRETRSWLEANAPASLFGQVGTELDGTWGGRKATYPDPDVKLWLDRMAARGFTAPTWPREYGGGGLDGAQAKVLCQLLRELKLPPPLIGFGLTMIGPTLLRFGNEEQKKLHLPAASAAADPLVPGLFASPAPAPTSRRSRRRPSATATTTSSTGRRSGPPIADNADWIFALVRTNPRPRSRRGSRSS